MFEPVPGSGGAVIQPLSAGRRPPAGARPPGVSRPGFTDEPAELTDAGISAAPVDPAVQARMRQIAARLAMPRPRRDSTARRGSGALDSLPYRGGSDDIDLDRTLEVLAERPVPEDEDIVVRDRIRTRRSVVLAVDVSGSMKGERLQTAAAAVGALAAELHQDALAVIAFWSDAALLLPLGGELKPMELLDTLLRMPARGLTNISFPLELAHRQLARIPVRDARVLLLSDCVHNAGPDPRVAAARLPRLDVLIDTSAETDVDLGRELARSGRGTARTIRTYRDVAPAVSAVFST
ncbi:VWA domain-containing protein [Arthrobacter jiangjiafuii]|uniref:VWA domain-containing protein n=1 Tax=Arthrobacter jiangjiafuii TaxID=2817475 RepID=A0A975M298_9MICC|nr:VWA domain-containing protein [Arthrobacter jiangjiafuii]MBP3043054.1 VWA domain-containing protein [Arthrobacter jiangjiafuii]QWC08623.1 VWA domain-containing protein [Arthrobacter jiangjiafuii]